MLKAILFPAFAAALSAAIIDGQIYLKAYMADPKTPFNWRVLGIRVAIGFATGALGGLGSITTFSLEP